MIQAADAGASAQGAAEISQAVNRVMNVLSLPPACSEAQGSSAGLIDMDSLLLDDLLQVVGAPHARKALLNKGLTLSQLKSMSAMELMNQGVIVFSELEAVMDALYSL